MTQNSKQLGLLPALLDENVQNASLNTQIHWLSKIFYWIQAPRSGDEKREKIETVYTTRLKFLLQLLKASENRQTHFIHTVARIMSEMSRSTYLTSAGLSPNRSFQQELFSRLQDKFLPPLPSSQSLDEFIIEVFPDIEESAYVLAIHSDVLDEILTLFCHETTLHLELKRNLLNSAHSLSIDYLATAHSLLKLLGHEPNSLLDLAEYRFEKNLRHQLEHLDELTFHPNLAQIRELGHHLDRLEALMQDTGVKIDLVYDFKTQRRRLNRLHALLSLNSAEIPVATALKNLLAQFILDCHHQKSLRSFLHENLTLMTQRVVQSNSHHGEHYVTYNWVDFKKMYISAAGAGVITAVTVYVKHFLSHLRLSDFLKGIADSLNYSISFLIIQLLGYTLATKQPSATAPFLASVINKSLSVSRRSIVALLRTQFIAVLGNLSLVFPLCFLISWAAVLLGYPLYSPEDALHAFEANSILGPSAVYALFTGFLLFFGSLVAGWFENFCLVNKIELRIQNSPKLIHFFGEKYTRRLGSFISENANALAGNFCLGFLLGLTPKILKFLGLPLEVRHVTLATGQFASSLPVLGPMHWSEFANVVIGLLCIGLLNIGVSFLFALFLASVSSQISLKSFLKLLRWGLFLVLTRPWLLLVPEKEPQTKSAAH